MSSLRDKRYRRIEVSPAKLPGTSRWFGVIRGVVVGLIEDGGPMVDFPANPAGEPILAISLVAVREKDRGREAVLMFEDGDPRRPIIMGLVQGASKSRTNSLEVDGETLELTAERQVILRCGEASITLTRSGKVLIRGKYVLSRSSGVNMVKGGVIHLN
jgi:hypothetical protein